MSAPGGLIIAQDVLLSRANLICVWHALQDPTGDFAGFVIGVLGFSVCMCL